MLSDNGRRTGNIHLSLSMNLGIRFSRLGVNPKSRRILPQGGIRRAKAGSRTPERAHPLNVPWRFHWPRNRDFFTVLSPLSPNR